MSFTGSTCLCLSLLAASATGDHAAPGSSAAIRNLGYPVVSVSAITDGVTDRTPAAAAVAARSPATTRRPDAMAAIGK